MRREILFSLMFLFTLLVYGGAPTLKTIIINGNMQDWNEVLSNPNNVTLDGASASDCQYSSDRDCPVQSTGRDMVRFAWTYDTTNIYLYVERTGSSSNIQNFFFIMDVTQDKLMTSSDFVLHVSYQGSNRKTNITLYRYSPYNPSGDPLVDANGFADGYDMPGSLVSIPSNDPSYFAVSDLIAGSVDGLSFETYVPWSKLLVPYGTPIFYHVSSGNNASLAQVDDNLGGPGGGIGAFGYYWVQIYPDHISSITPGNSASYNHTVKNNGSFDDIIDLYATSTTSSSISFYKDNTLIAFDSNGNGSFNDSGDYIDPSYDSNNNGLVDLSLSAWQSAEIMIVIGLQNLPEGFNDETTIVATSNGDGSYASTVDKTYIGTISIYPSFYLYGTPSQFVKMDFILRNSSQGGYLNLKVNSLLRFPIYLYQDSSLLGYDLEGDGVWDYIVDGRDGDGDGVIDFYLNQGEDVTFTLYVTIPSEAEIPSLERVTILSYNSTNSVNIENFIEIRDEYEISPSYSLSDNTEKYGASGKPLLFSHKVQNNSSMPVVFSFYAPSYGPYNENGYPITIYSDPDGDGNPSDGTIITKTDEIEPFGGVFHFIVRIDIPSSVTPPAVSNSLISLVKCQDSNCTQFDYNKILTTEDDLRVSYIVSFVDENRTINGNRFVPCNVCYIKAFNLVPNSSNRYGFRLLDPQNNILVQKSKYSDSSGSFEDDYYFDAQVLGGTYSLQLTEYGNVINEIPLIIERNGIFNGSINPLGRNLNSFLELKISFSNQSLFKDISSSKFSFVVKSPDGTKYLTPEGQWVNYYEGGYTFKEEGINVYRNSIVMKEYLMNNITFPTYGVYSLCSSWDYGCGSVGSYNDDIYNQCLNFYVVSLNSYKDESRTIEENNFVIDQNVYFKGEGYLANGYYNVAIYGSSYERVSFVSNIQAGNDGIFYYQINGNTLNAGSYILAIYPAYYEAPQTFNFLDENLIAYDQFTIFERVLLRYAMVSREPPQPPLNQVFINYPNSPSLSLDRDVEVFGFSSAAPFPHEESDLALSPPLVFYEVFGAQDTLRVRKESNKIIIEF